MEEPIQLYVERDGAGPPIVLAHGFGGSARNFRKQARALAGAYTVITYDARGHARSAAPPEASAYTTEHLVGDFARVVESAGAPAVVGGVSLGAYTALTYALTAKVPPRALVLAAYPGFETNPRRVRWALDFARAIEERGLDGAGAEFAWGGATRFDPASAALIRQGFLEHAPHALAAILRQVLAKIPEPASLAPQLEKLTMPALLIAGENDPDALVATDQLCASLPNVRKVVIPGAGHVVNLQAPTAFNDAVRRFLDGL